MYPAYRFYALVPPLARNCSEPKMVDVSSANEHATRTCHTQFTAFDAVPTVDCPSKILHIERFAFSYGYMSTKRLIEGVARLTHT